MNRMELFSNIVKNVYTMCEDIEIELADLSINEETCEWDGYGVPQENEYYEDKTKLHELIGMFTLHIVENNWQCCYFGQDILTYYKFSFLNKTARWFINALIENGFLK